MSIADSRLPVIIGVGQTVRRDLAATAEDLPNPIALAAEACRAALADTGVKDLQAAIDTLAFVRLNSDSIEVRPSPFGRCDNPPRSVAARIGANPRHAVYSILGGQAPQSLVNEAANLIAAGERELIMLTGAEAIGAMKQAQRKGWTPDWNEAIGGQLEDRGPGKTIVSPYEIANGMGFPPQVYGAFENAWRHERGIGKAEHRRRMAELFAPFSRVAAQHAYAQFPEARSVDFLAQPSKDNYDIADPYLKWHVAQDAVNQAATVILTSVAKARALGVPEELWVYPLAGAEAADKYVVHRPSLSRSDAMAAALQHCLGACSLSLADISHMDLYSCFPCAVQFACDALGLDPFSRQLTQTGGLPFFGGAGNNYSMHAIASLVERLRRDPGSIGLILANGGFLSKDAAGLYSTRKAANWRPVDNTPVQAQVDAMPEVPVKPADQGGRIESYSVVYEKNRPFIGYAFCRTGDGGRFMARTATNDAETLRVLIEDDPLGVFVKPTVTEKRNLLELR